MSESSETDGEVLAEPLGRTGPDGVGDGDEVGAVGVGTGGPAHRQAGPARFTVRTGRACRGAGGTDAGETALGSPPSTRGAAGRRCGHGLDGPIPESAVT